MNLDKTLSLKERQKLAAERTHQTRQKATESKIRAVCRSLQEKGCKLTQVAVALATGLTRQTIAKYQHVLDEPRKSEASNVIPLEAGSGQSHGVNYGVHQISAPRRGSGEDLKKGQVGLFSDGESSGVGVRLSSASDPPD